MNKELLRMFPTVIRTFGNIEIFSSHDFINRLKSAFPTEYNNLVFQSSPHTVHASIGRLLSINQTEMHIRKVKSEQREARLYQELWIPFILGVGYP